jgi:SNF2 family DNA or RNA helicase
VHVGERDFFGTVTAWKNLELLEHNLHLNSVSLTRADMAIAGKPEIYRTMRYDLSPAHKKLYTQIVEEQLLELKDGVVDATTVQRLHHALQQVVLMPSNFSDDKTLRSAGLDVLDNVLDELGNDQIIVWLHYRRSIEGIMSYLLSKKVSVVAAYGGSDSDAAIVDFSARKARVLLANAGSIGAGVNLQFCQNALFLEYNSSAIASRQAAGRINRIGQTEATLTTWACANDTVQVKRLRDLLNNDGVASKLERTKSSLREALLGAI